MPTYDIVEQGADDTGGSTIDGVLENLVGSDTTIIFPPGTYKLNDLIVQSGTDRLELIAPNGARLVPGQSGDNLPWIDVYARGFVLDGFELDMRNTAVPPFVRMNSNSGDWELRRLITRGYVRAETDTNIGSNDSGDARTYFRLSAADGTRGLLQDCYFHEGSCEPDEASNRRAILVESGEGTLIFNRCWFEHWGENTIYAKKPEGEMRILNSFVRNSQNGMRLGGNTDVQNCVSIKDAQHPTQAWSGGSLQRGVNVEANVPANSSGVNSYDGTISIIDCDFYHRYPNSSCGGPITAPAPCQRIDIRRTRISYDSTKNHDAIYTYDATMYDGTPANLEYLRLQDVQVTNDHDSEYAIYIGQEPDEWGQVSGVLGGSGPQTNSSYIEDQMTINGNPTPPNTTPPLPSPPPLGEIPMENAQLVRIDNTSNNSPSFYEITAGEYVLPAGNEGATIATGWGPDGEPTRPPNSEVATGTVPAGKVFAFYVTGGIVSTESDGLATWTVDGEVYNPGTEGILMTDTITSGEQGNEDQWKQADSVGQPTNIAIAKPLSFNGTQPCHTRLRNVDGTFEYKLEEWTYLDGSHTSETFNTLATKPGEQESQLGDGSSYRVKAGTVEVDQNFDSVSLDDFFGSETPVVLAQAQTFDGSDPIVTRLRNVSNGSFDVRVQEEEAAGSHVPETVGYIALQQATGTLSGTPFEVRQTDTTVNQNWTRLTFDHQYTKPQFIANMQTFNGPDTANLRYRNLTSTGVEVKVEEEQSTDTETNHTNERVGYAVFEGATLITNTLSSNQESRNQWQQADSVARPDDVVIAKPLSFDGTQPCHTRLRNVDGAFEYKLEEWEYLDGLHTSEMFHTLAMGSGEREIQLDNGTSYRVKAGEVPVQNDFVSVSLDDFFGTETPIVLAQVQTFNGPDPIVTRIRDVSNGSFDVCVQEEEASSDNGFHNTETVGYIALQQTTGEIDNTPFEIQRAESTVTDEWSRITFRQQYDTPRFVAGMQTFNGPDTANLRYRNLTSTGVEVKIEEEQSADTETNHTTERVGYAVFEDSV